MHRLAREERLRGKKLRGKRRRKEAERERAPGQDFRVDVADERFAALLEGDTRFGIDRTDSSFKVCRGGVIIFLSWCAWLLSPSPAGREMTSSAVFMRRAQKRVRLILPEDVVGAVC